MLCSFDDLINSLLEFLLKNYYYVIFCLDTITPAEVGLDDVLEDDRGHGFFGSNFFTNSNRTARWAQPITYLHIYECENFTVSLLNHLLCPFFPPKFSVLLLICLVLASFIGKSVC